MKNVDRTDDNIYRVTEPESLSCWLTEAVRMTEYLQYTESRPRRQRDDLCLRHYR